MARYTIRVELHDHRTGDYDRLHEAMAREEFMRTIGDSEGNTFHLPPAEYNYQGEIEDKGVILRKAESAASSIRPSFEVLVTKSDGRTWHNLRPV